MKSILKSIVSLSLLAALTVVSGQRLSQQPIRHAPYPAISTMVADGDIGDGTSPSKKG